MSSSGKVMEAKRDGVNTGERMEAEGGRDQEETSSKDPRIRGN